MDKWKFSSDYQDYEITFEFTNYVSNGATAVLSSSYGNISSNIETAPILPKGQFYLKDWSENTSIAKALVDEKLIEPVKGAIPALSGFIVAYAYQFTEKGLKYVENAKEFLTHKG